MHRVAALARGIGIDPRKPIENLHFAYKPAGIDLMNPWWAEHLAKKAAEVEAALVGVDVLRAAARIKENAAEEFAELKRNLAPVLDGSSVNIAHHFTKLSETSKERDPLERMSGSGAFGGQVDTAILITGSSHGARKLRIEYAVRDGAEPKAHGAYLEGHGTGTNGAFTDADTAFWRPTEIPSPERPECASRRDRSVDHGAGRRRSHQGDPRPVRDQHRHPSAPAALPRRARNHVAENQHRQPLPRQPQPGAGGTVNNTPQPPHAATTAVRPMPPCGTSNGFKQPNQPPHAATTANNPCGTTESTDLQGKRIDRNHRTLQEYYALRHVPPSAAGNSPSVSSNCSLRCSSNRRARGSARPAGDPRC